ADPGIQHAVAEAETHQPDSRNRKEIGMNRERRRRRADATFECDLSQGALMDTRVIAACVVVAAAAGSCRRSPVESPSARVDELFAEWNKPDSPGCSVGISQ